MVYLEISSFAKTSIEEQWRIHAGCNYDLKATVIFSGLNLYGEHCTGRSIFQLKHDLNTHLILHMGRLSQRTPVYLSSWSDTVQ
jgi:hypothetical protein